jgi:hypothetical protein
VMMFGFNQHDGGCCDDHEEQNWGKDHMDATLGLFIRLPFIPNRNALLSLLDQRLSDLALFRAFWCLKLNLGIQIILYLLILWPKFGGLLLRRTSQHLL